MLSATLLTPNQAGAIAIVSLHGSEAEIDRFITQSTTASTVPVGAIRLTSFVDQTGEIDSGLVTRLSGTEVYLMPHGGLRVVQRILERCVDLGMVVQNATELQPNVLFPEADDTYVALMLAALSRARSPLAIDLLLDQPRRWRELPTITDEDRARSKRLNHLITPPLVVLAGPANVGKSTLSNRLLGWTMSIAIDQPGTTRDYTAGMIDLHGLVVHWHDTPGLRETDDPIERDAIELARKLMLRADMLIAITDHEHDWPVLPRQPDLKIANKNDITVRSDSQLNISSTTGDGIAELVTTVRELLVPSADREHNGPWLFDERLLANASADLP